MNSRGGGFEAFTMDDYEVTENGEVFNIRWGRRPVKPQLNGKGYYRVWMAGKLRFVHRLVAEKYVPNPDNKPQVNHKDGNKLNNCADNLEWVSNQENRNHAIINNLQLCGEKDPKSKLTQKEVEFIRANPQMSSKILGEMFGVARTTVNDVKQNRTWKNS